MPSTASPETDLPTARTWSTVLLVLLGPIGIWTAAVLAGSALAANALPAGQCEGIGWGCTLTPRDGILLAGLVAGVVVVPIATIVAAIVARVSSAADQLRNVLVLLACFAGLVVTAAAFMAA